MNSNEGNHVLAGCLSEYELYRLNNIKRNEAFLEQIGLSTGTIKTNDMLKAIEIKPKIKREVIKRRITLPIVEPTRQSKRIRSIPIIDEIEEKYDEEGVSTQNTKPSVEYVEVLIDEETSGRKHISDQILFDFISNTNPNHIQLITEDDIHHCVKRITSMSNNKLGTRIKMISTGKGLQSYIKLLVFQYGLRASGLEQLADSCTPAIKTLEKRVE
eukprot:gene10129-13627_t